MDIIIVQPIKGPLMRVMVIDVHSPDECYQSDDVACIEKADP